MTSKDSNSVRPSVPRLRLLASTVARAIRPTSMAALAGIALLAGAACSTTVFDRSECVQDAECLVLGAGYTCGEAGYCIAPSTTADPCDASRDCPFSSTCSAAGQCEPITEVQNRCTKTYPEDLWTRPDRDDFLVVGGIQDRAVITKLARERSVELAFKLINDRGGLSGRQFGVVFCTAEEDTKFDQLDLDAAAVQSATWLASTVGLPAIIGPSASGRTSKVFQAIAGTETLVISPSATSPALTNEDETMPTNDNPGLLWRTAPSDAAQAVEIAGDMSTRNIANVSVVYQTGAYGEELNRLFENAYGGTITNALPYTNASDIGGHVATLAAQGVAPEEILFISSSADDIKGFLAAKSSQTSLDATTIFLPDAGANSDALNSSPDSVLALIRGTRPKQASGMVFGAFSSSYSAEYGESVDQFSFTAQSYDAAWMVALGISYAVGNGTGPITGIGIAKGMRKMSSSSGLAVEFRGSQWISGSKALSEGSAIDIVGASGPLDYDPATEETTAPLEVWLARKCSGMPLEFFEATGVDPCTMM